MTDTEIRNNFLGIPVEGDPVYSSEQRITQRPIEELQVALKKLLEYDSFTALRWKQYTPYFNDGDPCVFGVHGASIKIPGADDVGDYEDGFMDLPNSYVSGYYSDETNEAIAKTVGVRHGRTYNRETRSYDRDGEGWKVTPNDPDMAEQAEKVCGMIESGAFNDALLKMFGDHAIVTVTREKIDIEFYEHD